MAYFDSLENAKTSIKISIFINVILSVIIMFLITVIVGLNQNKVVSVTIPPIPMKNTELLIGNDDANDATYKVFGEYFAKEIGNFSYKNFETKSNFILKYVDYDNYASIAADFKENNDNIKNNFISQKFMFKSSKIKRLDNGIVKVTNSGLATRKVGDHVEFEELPYNIEIYLKVSQGNVLIEKIVGYLDQKSIANTRKAKEVKKHKDENPYVSF